MFSDFLHNLFKGANAHFAEITEEYLMQKRNMMPTSKYADWLFKKYTRLSVMYQALISKQGPFQKISPERIEHFRRTFHLMEGKIEVLHREGALGHKELKEGWKVSER